MTKAPRYDIDRAPYCLGCMHKRCDLGDWVSDEDVCKQEALLASIRRWLQLWRTNDVDSTAAMRQIGIDFDVFEEKKTT